MKEKVQGSLNREEPASSCNLSIALPGPCIVVAIPCGRHAWADHHARFHSQCHSPTISISCAKLCLGLFSSLVRYFCIMVYRKARTHRPSITSKHRTSPEF